MTDSWHSYPSIYALGHRALVDLFDGEVVVQEKIDGSQLSCGVFGSELRCRSKGQQLVVDAPDKMFELAVQQVKERQFLLHEGWTYRAEYLMKPKHNALAYARAPKGNLIIFDINTGLEEYAPPEIVAAEAERLGLEAVPTYHRGTFSNAEARTLLERFLERESCLGGQRVEGVVVKNYARYGPDKKALMGKFVSEQFKEVHAREWRQSNPNAGDVIATLIDRYRTPARWAKAVHHLRDAGTLERSPRDIGALMKEVPTDVEKECADDIRDALWAWAWPKIRRGVAAGLAEWYRKELFDRQFEGGDTPTTEP